jgi:hypothetical protein
MAYLNLNLTNKQGHLEMEIYRKSTVTDMTINNNSCHSMSRGSVVGIATGYGLDD